MMDDYIDVMMDIETLGTDPGAPILQIAAKTFKRNTAHEDWMALHVDIKVDMQSCLDLGLTKITADTLQFWFNQDRDTAQSVLFGGDRVLIRHAIIELNAWAQQLDGQVCWWAKGPDFDNVLVEAAAGLAGMVVPWKYNSKRCVRTLQDISDCPDSRLKQLSWFREPDHDALADCEQQIDIVRHCLKQIDVVNEDEIGF